MKTFTFEDIFCDKKTALVVVAHPDDADVFFGGTIARLVAAGKTVHVCVMTSGAKGSQDKNISEEELSAMRRNEQIAALSSYGLSEKNLTIFDLVDGEVENTWPIIEKVARMIRKVKPDIILTHDPHDMYRGHRRGEEYFYINHRDHRNTGMCVLDAVYPFARDRSFFREHMAEGLEPHTVFDILLAGPADTNTQIDISAVIKKKHESLSCHKSQWSEEDLKWLFNRDKRENSYKEEFLYLHLAW